MKTSSHTHANIVDVYAVVDRLPGGRGDKPYVFRIISPIQPTAREIAASSEEDMLQWIQCIRECSCNAERAVCLQFFLSVDHANKPP